MRRDAGHAEKKPQKSDSSLRALRLRARIVLCFSFAGIVRHGVPDLRNFCVFELEISFGFLISDFGFLRRRCPLCRGGYFSASFFPSVFSLQPSVFWKRLPARADFQYAMARKHPGHARDVRPYAVFSIGPREEHVAPREALQSAARLQEARRRVSVRGHASLSRCAAALCKIACHCAEHGQSPWHTAQRQ